MLSGSAAACARGLPRLIPHEGFARRNWMSKARVDKDHAAVIFPGQGAQLVGMGKDLYDAYPEARRVYEEMDEILGERLTKLVFEGPQCKLNATENAQPAILATSMSMVRVLEERFGLRVEDECSYALGHSMGEYTALCAARSLSFGDGVRLLRARGQAMQSAVRNKSVAMVALITGPHGIADLEAAMVELTKELPSGEIAELASVNSTFQVAISGTTRGVDIASRYFERNHLAVRAVDIPVSVPSHCSLMLAAAEELKEKMESMKFAEPVVPVLSDVTAQPIQSAREIPDLLFKQITSKVRWLDCINYVRSRGIDDFIVYGPSKVLSNLLRREHPMDRIRPVVCASSVEEFVKAALENRERREQRQEHGHGL